MKGLGFGAKFWLAAWLVLAATLTACGGKGGGSSSSSNLTSGAPSNIVYAANPAYFAINTAITPDTATVSTPVSAFAVSPSLPTGLTIDAATGTISGTPTVSQGLTNYTVSGTNSYGENFTTLTIAVVSGKPVISYAGPYTTYRQIAITPIAVTNTGGLIQSCSISPALPSGLSFNTATCGISGTPGTTLSGPTTYTVTATNVVGSATATFQLTVTDQAPAISYSPSSQTLTHNVATTINVTNTGGYIPTGGCAVTSGTLPAGLSLNANTCQITGTPTTIGGPSTVTVTATNAGGSSATNLTLTVGAQPPTIVYAGSPYTLYDTRNTNLNITPTLGGDPLSGCTVTPSLSAGLSLNASTCVISGPPTVAQAATAYTIKATNAGGSATTVINITVDEVPPVISYSGSPFTFYKNTAITPANVTNTAGPITSCSVSPPLPSGLALNTSTCQISGTPTVTASPASTYTVTATNSAGSGSTTISILVDDQAVSFFYPATPYTYTKGTMISTVVPTSTGGAITSCAYNASCTGGGTTLPAGLTLNSDCSISGTPTAVTAATSCTIKGTNSTGQSSTANIQVTVNDVAPNITFAGSPYNFAVNYAITAVTPANSGGTITGCTSTPTLPTGLSISNTTCKISGTPTATQSLTNYVIKATNTGGSSSVTIQIEVTSNAPNLSYSAPASYTYTNGTAITALDALNPSPAGAPGTCSSSPALPTGLSVAATAGTCEITGTPTQVVASTVYSITGTNTGGSSSANVTITVNDVPPVISYPSSPYVFVQNQAITAINVTNSSTPAPPAGGVITSCSSSPALPAGLSLSSTCQITGTPTVVQSATNYDVTATNSGGSSSANISIAVDGAPTVTTIAQSTYPIDGANPPLIQGSSYTIATATDPAGGNVTLTCTYQTLGLNSSDPNYAASGTNCTSLMTLASVNSTTVAQAAAISGSGTTTADLTWTPTVTERGTYEFSFTATNTVGSTSKNVIVTVREPDTKTNLLTGFDALDATNASGLSSSDASAPFSSSASAGSWLQLLSSPANATLNFTGTPNPWGGTGQDSTSAVSPYSLSYGGASDYVSVGTAISSATKAAVETWVEPSSPSSATRTIAGNGGGIANGMAIRQSSTLTGHASFVVGQKYYAYQDLVLSDQPSSYWRLDESSGTSAADSSAYGNTGTYSGTYTLGASGGTTNGDTAVTLNGSSGYVYTSNSYTNPSPFSVEVWFKTSSANGKIIGFENNQTGSFSSNYDRMIYIGSGGEICFGVYSTGVNEVCTSTAYDDGAWHSAVGTFSSGGVLTFYVDGSLASVGTNSACTGTGTNPCTIGGTIQSYTGYWRLGSGKVSGWNDAPASGFFNGSLGEAAVYPVQLSSAQVTKHYQTGKNGNYVAYPGNAILADQPVSYWRLNDGLGPSAADDSGNSNTGTYQGTVTLGQTGGLTGDTSTAAKFDGSTGFVTTTTSYSNPTSFSIEVWFNTTSTSGGGLIGLASNQTGTGGGSSDRAIYMNNNGTLTFWVGSGGASKITTASSYNNGTWHQAVGTYSSATGMDLYVDGSNVATGSNTPTSYTGYWRIGHEIGVPGTTSRFIAGTIQEAAVYGYPLSPTQISNHYNSGNGPAWWTCLSRTSLSSSLWSLLQGVWDGTNATLYLNGQQECQVSPGTTYSGSAANAYAGADSSQNSSSFWSGLMSTLKFYGTSDGITNPLLSTAAYTDFAAEANRFREQPVENIYTSNLVLSLDAGNANEGVAPYSSGCTASASTEWWDLSSSAADALLSGFASCGWTGSGTTASPFAISFNGTSDYASFSEGSSLGTTYTVEAWVDPTSIAASAGIVSNGTIYLGGSSGSKWQFNSAVSSSAGSTGTWAHVVGVQNGTSQSLYVDGNSVGSATGSVSLGSGTVDIGLNGTTYFSGKVATLRIYSGALTQQQIKQNCLAQELRFTSTPQSICAAP